GVKKGWSHASLLSLALPANRSARFCSPCGNVSKPPLFTFLGKSWYPKRLPEGDAFYGGRAVELRLLARVHKLFGEMEYCKNRSGTIRECSLCGTALPGK